MVEDTRVSFVHLRLHTEYSLLDSVVRIPELIQAVAAQGMPAVAITDQSNLFALVKFYKAALAGGVQPIVGVDVALRETAERAAPARFTLLCQSQVGYRNITRLISRAYQEGQRHSEPLLEREWLTRDSVAGLIGLSGAQEGDIGRALLHGRAEVSRTVDFWLDLFEDRWYLELQRLGRPQEAQYLDAAVALAAKKKIPVVATNDVRFLQAADFTAHEARVCIHEGTLLADKSRPRRYTTTQYLRTPAEMNALFADLPSALANSVQIAKRCSLMLQLGETRLPAYPVPANITAEQFLRDEAQRGLIQRFEESKSIQVTDEHAPRLQRELDVICQMGFAGYFLIVADFIRWARENGVPVGPGRGSGAGSLVAYSLGITDLDPLAHDLLFERFLNPERVSLPDFDVDFCMEGRDRVIDYVAQKYGRERVSQIITYGTMAAKAVVRDCGRVLGMGYGFVDRIAKLIPFELGITLADALKKEAELKALYDSDEDIRGLIDLALSLEGLTRNAGTHAGGVVIAPSVLTDFAPLYCEEGSTTVVTQFDKDDVEAAGLIKFDFLGLRTLTIIDRAVVLINQLRVAQGELPIQIDRLPMNDAVTFALLKSCRTTAVFQLESSGMKDLIRRLLPDSFEDIVALVALFRPGPLQSGMVDDFINRKHGRIDGPIDYLHPELKPVLQATYGVILYQEQVMQIAQVLAGYTLGGADLLRRAMGKKKPEEMAKQRSIFVDGAVARGVQRAQAAHIFDLMEKFAGYGFNKSHSAAYALLSYQTAYLKAHYPAAFMAAVLSSDMDNTDKIVILIRDCEEIGLRILPPDINHSAFQFTVADDRTIRYGLGAIRGLGQSAVETLLAEAAQRGPFSSLQDLCRRLDLQRLNKRTLEALIRAGSLDGLQVSRAQLLQTLPTAMQLGDQATRAKAAGQVDLFGLSTQAAAPAATVSTESPVLYTEMERLKGERDTLGLYLTGHPLAAFEADLEQFVSQRIASLQAEKPQANPGFGGGRAVSVAGLIDEIRKRGSRTILTLDDRSGRLEAVLFDEAAQKYRELIVKDALVVVNGKLRFDEFSHSWRLAATRLQPLDQIRQQRARRLILTWPADVPQVSLLDRLMAVLTPWRGGPCPITVEYRAGNAAGAFTLGDEWSVKLSRELVEQISALLGSAAIKVVYGVTPETESVGQG
jgi:DNA polymerase III subunit alpha